MHLLDGKSFREAAADADIDKDTVLRIWKRFVAYCEETMGGLLKEFNIRLDDLIVLLYQRGGHARRASDAEPTVTGRRTDAFWDTLYRGKDIGTEEGLCREHD